MASSENMILIEEHWNLIRLISVYHLACSLDIFKIVATTLKNYDAIWLKGSPS